MSEVLRDLMESSTSRIDLYSQPEFYDLIYSEEYPHGELADLIERETERGDTVLSVGCGSGILLEKIDGRKLTGIDLSEDMLEKAAEKTDANLSKHNIAQEELDKEFDLIEVTGQVLNHAEGREELGSMLDNIISCLKQDGKLIFDIWISVEDGLKLGERSYEIDGFKISLSEQFCKMESSNFKMEIKYRISREREKVLSTEIEMYIPEKEEVEEILSGKDRKFSRIVNFFSSDNLIMLESDEKT